GFRKPVVAAIASYFAVNSAEADPEPIKAKVRSALEAAPPGGRSDRDIARYCSERHLNDIVGWVRRHERSRPPRSPRPAVDLNALAAAAPVAEERRAAVRAIAAALLRCDSIPVRLALSLIKAWNETHCSPPLAREEVQAIVDASAGRQATRVEASYA